MIWLKVTRGLLFAVLAIDCVPVAGAPPAAASEAYERFRAMQQPGRERREEERRQQQAQERRAEYEQRLQSLRDAVAKGQSIGLMAGPIPEPMRNQFAIPADVRGVLVSDVVSPSSAAKAGVQRGDVITRLGGATVQTDADWKRGFEAVKNSRNSQFTVSVYNVNTRATREITLELPDGMRSTTNDLVGNEAAALYAVAVPEFASKNCPQLMPNWSRVSELLLKFQIDRDVIKAHPKYAAQMDTWKEIVAKSGSEALCEEMIRTTYTSPLGGHMVTGVIHRR